jgi:hypothetical protein
MNETIVNLEMIVNHTNFGKDNKFKTNYELK